MNKQRNHYPNSGALFKNRGQREGQKDPDYQGEGLVDCPHCKLSFKIPIDAWVKVAKNAAKSAYLSISFSRAKRPKVRPT